MRILAILRRAVEFLCAACFIIMVCSITLQVAGRYIFSFRIADFVELSTFLQIWLVCLGSGLAVRYRALFAVDLMASRLSPRAKALQRFVTVVLAGVFVAAMIPGMKKLIAFGMIQTAPTLQFPMWVVYAALPVGLSYFMVEILAAAFESDEHSVE